MAKKKRASARRVKGLTGEVFIGFSADGAEIVATYMSRHEAESFRQPDEIVTGPWMRVPRDPHKRKLVRDVVSGYVV